MSNDLAEYCAFTGIWLWLSQTSNPSSIEWSRAQRVEVYLYWSEEMTGGGGGVILVCWLVSSGVGRDMIPVEVSPAKLPMKKPWHPNQDAIPLGHASVPKP